MMTLGPLGDRAFLARFDSEEEAGRWASTLRSQKRPAIRDVVLAYQSAAVFTEPELTDVELDRLEAELRELRPRVESATSARLIRLPVLYDGADLSDSARRLGLEVDALVAHHSARDYHVFAIGFLPGFPYAGYLPEALSGLPRRETPRVRVPAGSVAIAGRQTGVYPESSPGGWHLIGRTPLRIVEIETGYFPIQAGDRIRFDPIDALEFEARKGERL